MKLSEFEIGDIVQGEYSRIKYLGKTPNKDTHSGFVIYSKDKYKKENQIYTEFSDDYSNWTLVEKAKKGNQMFNNSNIKNQIQMNKEILEQEAEKQVGKFILEQVTESEIYQDLPGFVRNILNKPYGKWIVVNLLIFISNFYSGQFKDELDRVKSCLLRASVSEMGDTYVNSFFDNIIKKIKEKFPKKDA